MVNSVFSGGGSCHIMICDAAKYFSQYNGGCLPNKGTDINHLFTKIQNFYDDLLKNILVSEILIRTNFDKIVKYLQDLKDSNVSQYTITRNNVIEILTILLNDMRNAVNSNFNYLSSFSNEQIQHIIEMVNVLDFYLNLIVTEQYESSNEVVELFRQLYDNVGKDLDALLKDYTFGDFDQFKQTYTQEVFENLAKAILDEQNENLTFENIRLIFNTSLESLQRSFTIQKSLETEIVALRATIYEMKNKSLLSTTETLNVVAQLKPEYLIYVQRYGMPINGIFEADKLAEILNE